MKFEAALYDLDGLMVDSEPLHGEASERALNVYGRTLEELPDEVRASFYGKRVIDIASLIVDSLGLEVDPGRWADERHELFMGLIEEGIELMPGMRESLDEFDSLGIKKAVVSSGVSRYVIRLLELTGLADEFEAVVTGDEVVSGKPDPECYLEGARRLGVAPERCIVLEDALAGIQAGREAGMTVIAVRNRFNEEYAGAHAVLGSLAEIDEKLLAGLDGPEGRSGR